MKPTTKYNDIYGLEDVDRRGFVGLMDLYENNFIRFKKLVGDIEQLNTNSVSQVFGCMDLHMFIEDCGKYTTDIKLTYAFAEQDSIFFEPDLKCRIYNDADVIEVLAGHLKHGKHRLDHLPAASLRLKWKLNRFLYKWLGYCLYLGHSFEAKNASNIDHKIIKSGSVTRLVLP